MLRSPEVTVALGEFQWLDPRTWVVAWRGLGINGVEHEEDKELDKESHASLKGDGIWGGFSGGESVS